MSQLYIAGIRTDIGHWLSASRHGWQLAWFIAGSLILGALMLGLLTSTPPRYRKIIVMIVTFLAGLYFSLEFLLPHEPFLTKAPTPLAATGRGVSDFGNWLTGIRPFVGSAVQIIWSFALLLGVWNLFQIHGKAVAKRNQGWYNSAAFFIAFFSIMILGLVMYGKQHQLESMKPGSPEFAAVQAAAERSENLFRILFRGFLTSLDATMFSLIAFYIVSAAYRAFRIRSTEAVLMMGAAGIIMLALVPVGVLMTSWLPERGFFSIFRLENIGYWLLISPNMAAQRAINFGVAVGSLAMGLRIWLSLERGSFFDRQL